MKLWTDPVEVVTNDTDEAALIRHNSGAHEPENTGPRVRLVVNNLRPGDRVFVGQQSTLYCYTNILVGSKSLIPTDGLEVWVHPGDVLVRVRQHGMLPFSTGFTAAVGLNWVNVTRIRDPILRP